MLAYHFSQIAFAVFCVTRSVGHNVDDGYFFPGQHTEFVAHFQQGIILRIMGDADKVGAHFFHQHHVAAVHLVRQCDSDGLLVLVAANAT